MLREEGVSEAQKFLPLIFLDPETKIYKFVSLSHLIRHSIDEIRNVIFFFPLHDFRAGKIV